MNKNIINIKYIWLLVILITFSACNDAEDFIETEEIIELPALTAGTADLSNYVALGASFTAGFTDGALFKASQSNSFPNILSQQFANAGGGAFTQPLMNDNFGGLAAGGTRITDPRLVFGGAGPVGLESLIGEVTVSTDIVLNNPSGPFNNLGVPGAKSFHLLAPGYGNFDNFPAAANPYAVRIAGSTDDSILSLAIDQSPTFFTLSEIGGNDVLGYATTGGDGTNNITDSPTFDFAFNTLVTSLTSGGAKGVVTNVPYITDLPHFTAVPYAPLDPSNPAFGPLIPTLNNVFGALNGVYAFLQSQGAITDAAKRTITFSSTSASAVVIKDEDLPDLSAQIAGVLGANPAFAGLLAQFGLPTDDATVGAVAALFGATYGQARQATSDDLLVLPSGSIIGTVNTNSVAFLMSQGLPQAIAGQFSAEGVSLPLEDKWVLTPEEQTAIKTATDAYNVTIESIASSNSDVALVDLNGILQQLASTGIKFDDYTMNASLVTGGAVGLDGIHLTARGYAFMANKFLEAIDDAFSSNFIESGNVAKAGDYPTNYSPTLQ